MIGLSQVHYTTRPKPLLNFCSSATIGIFIINNCALVTFRMSGTGYCAKS